MSVVEITTEQFQSGASDLMAIIRQGNVQPNEAARIGVDLCLVVGYPLQWVRDRQSPEGRPVFGERGVSQYVDTVADTFREIALACDPECHGAIVSSAHMGGPAVDWIVQLAIRKLIDWLLKNGMNLEWKDLLEQLLNLLNVA